MRGCGTLGECVVTGIGKVMAVSISTGAVRKSFCKKTRKWLSFKEAPLKLGGKRGKQINKDKRLDCFHITSRVGYPPAQHMQQSSWKQQVSAFLPALLKNMKYPQITNCSVLWEGIALKLLLWYFLLFLNT